MRASQSWIDHGKTSHARTLGFAMQPLDASKRLQKWSQNLKNCEGALHKRTRLGSLNPVRIKQTSPLVLVHIGSWLLGLHRLSSLAVHRLLSLAVHRCSFALVLLHRPSSLALHRLCRLSLLVLRMCSSAVVPQPWSKTGRAERLLRAASKEEVLAAKAPLQA